MTKHILTIILVMFLICGFTVTPIAGAENYDPFGDKTTIIVVVDYQKTPVYIHPPTAIAPKCEMIIKGKKFAQTIHDGEQRFEFTISKSMTDAYAEITVSAGNYKTKTITELIPDGTTYRDISIPFCYLPVPA